MTLRERLQGRREARPPQLQWILRVATLIIFSASSARVGHSNTSWPYLQGTKQLALVIEDVSNDVGSCIVDKDQLRKSLISALSPTKIGLFVDGEAYINVTYNISSFSDGLCATDVSMSVRVYSIYVEDVAQLTGGFQVWNRSILVSSLRQHNASRVPDAALVLAKQLIEDWGLNIDRH